jgi:hypothetical protein
MKSTSYQRKLNISLLKVQLALGVRVRMNFALNVSEQQVQNSVSSFLLPGCDDLIFSPQKHPYL